MTISHRASAVPAGNPTTSFTITIPAGVQAGDILVLACTNRDATAAPTVSDNDAGGNAWVRKSSQVSKGSIWWKRATSATAGKTITASGFTGSSAGVASAFAGCIAAGDPFDTYTLEENASGNETHAGFTPSVADCWIGLTVHNSANDNLVTATACGNPGSLAALGEKLSTGGSDCAAIQAGATQVGGPAATNGFTWAQTNGITTSIAYALKPAAATIAEGDGAAGGVAAAPGAGAAVAGGAGAGSAAAAGSAVAATIKAGDAPAIAQASVSAPGAGVGTATGSAAAAGSAAGQGEDAGAGAVVEGEGSAPGGAAVAGQAAAIVSRATASTAAAATSAAAAVLAQASGAAAASGAASAAAGAVAGVQGASPGAGAIAGSTAARVGATGTAAGGSEVLGGAEDAGASSVVEGEGSSAAGATAPGSGAAVAVAAGESGGVSAAEAEASSDHVLPPPGGGPPLNALRDRRSPASAAQRRPGIGLPADFKRPSSNVGRRR